MRQHAPRLLRLALAFSLSLFTFLPASAMLDAGLVVVPEPNLRLTNKNQADFEVGSIKALETTQIEHTFTLRNEGNTQLIITQLQPSCHCTSITVEKIAGQKPAQRSLSAARARRRTRTQNHGSTCPPGPRPLFPWRFHFRQRLRRPHRPRPNHRDLRKRPHRQP